MKKALVLMLALLLSFSLFACGKDGMADGTYVAVVDEAFAADSGHGWQDQLTVTYQDGAMVSAVFESINMESGELKSVQTAETYPMDPPVATWMPQLNANVLEAGSSADIAVVAGATNASDAAKALLAGIEENGKPGETITVTITA